MVVKPLIKAAQDVEDLAKVLEQAVSNTKREAQVGDKYRLSRQNGVMLSYRVDTVDVTHKHFFDHSVGTFVDYLVIEDPANNYVTEFRLMPTSQEGYLEAYTHLTAVGGIKNYKNHRPIIELVVKTTDKYTYTIEYPSTMMVFPRGYVELVKATLNVAARMRHVVWSQKNR